MHSVYDMSTSRLLHYLLHRADETQQDQNSCPWLQFLAFLEYFCYSHFTSFIALFLLIDVSCLLFLNVSVTNTIAYASLVTEHILFWFYYYYIFLILINEFFVIVCDSEICL